MEQTINTWSKGLLTDIHPMVQGNDVLSDALNATFVTMNGNEIILQNDMGNRRIDNAFLPPGYEPVGIKEYGGVIYIAAYNPITNTGLVGSFPSPERKLSSSDVKNDLLGKLDTNSFFNGNSLKLESILVPLTNKVTLHAGDKFVVYKKSGNDLNISSVNSNVSNCYNTTDGKINSPKNKFYTLALGILNSLNEFVDITKSLVRWENNSIKSFDNGESDLYKFNYNYFIPTNYTANTHGSIKDRLLMQERLKETANTYAYKLIGPLYLKASINRMLEFNYNIYGNSIGKDSNGKDEYEIVLEGYITYNCPDGITGTNNGDDIYVSYLTGNMDSEKAWPYSFVLGSNTYSNTKDGGKLTNPLPKSIYNPETNLYSIKVVKKYIYTDSSNTKKVDYALAALAYDGKQTNYIIESLSTKGEIDLNKLGSGELNVTGWRFYNKDGITKLTYMLDAYPKYGLKFTNLKMEFYEVNSNNISSSPNFVLENELSINNGRNTVEIDWDKYPIKSRTLYQVIITYSTTDTILFLLNTQSTNLNNNSNTNLNNGLSNILSNSRENNLDSNLDSERYWHIDNGDSPIIINNGVPVIDINNTPLKPVEETEDSSSSTFTNKIKVGLKKEEDNTIKIYRWFLSTSLLNDCYNSSSPYFIKDYCLPADNNELYTLQSRLAILPNISVEIIDKSKEIEYLETGQFIKKITNNEKIECNSEGTLEVDLELKPIIGVLKEELYPEWAINEFKLVKNSTKYVVVSDIQDAEEYLKLINTNGSYTLLNLTNEEKINKLKEYFNVSLWIENSPIFHELNDKGKLVFKKSIKFYDRVKSEPSLTGSIKNIFGPALSTDTNTNYFINASCKQNIVLSTAFEHHGGIGGTDQKFFGYNLINGTETDLGNEGIFEKGIFSTESDNYIMFPESESPELKTSTMNFLYNIPKDCVISYCFDTDTNSRIFASSVNSEETTPPEGNPSNRKYYKTRVFWRRFDGYWTIIDTLLNKLDNIRDFIKRTIFGNNNIVYCYKDFANFNDLQTIYHVSSSPTEHFYNDPYSIKINYMFCLYSKIVTKKYLTVQNVEKNNALESYHFFHYATNDGIDKDSLVPVSPITYSITLDSNESFCEKVRKMITNEEFENMDIYGNTKTKEGLPLNKNKLYVLNNDNTLSESVLKNYKITSEYGAEGLNTIVYAGKDPVPLTLPYDLDVCDGDGSASISYSELEIYKPVLE